MRKGKLVLVVGALAGAAIVISQGYRPPAATGQPSSDAPSAVDAEVRKSVQKMEEAFNKRDAKAVAALWAEGGELTHTDGTVVRGRDELEKMYAGAFAAAPKARGKIEIATLRPLGKNLVSTEGALRYTPGDGQPTETTQYSALHVREGDQWLTASVREWVPDAPAADKLTDLEWLIGDWEAKRDGREVRTSYSWGDGKAFIVCKFRVTEKGTVAAAGTEILAKDPTTGQIRGWLFEQSGMLAEAFWMKDGQQWVVGSAGTLPDGAELEAANALVPNGQDTFSWVSIQRSAGGVRLATDTPLKVTRMKK